MPRLSPDVFIERTLAAIEAEDVLHGIVDSGVEGRFDGFSRRDTQLMESYATQTASGDAYSSDEIPVPAIRATVLAPLESPGDYRGMTY